MIRWISLLVLLTPWTCWGINSGGCHNTSGLSCTITITANGTIGVATVQQGTTSPPTDTLGNTYSVLATAVGGGSGCYVLTTNFGGGAIYECQWYTHNGVNSGIDTITAAGGNAELVAQFMTPSQVKNTGNPLDKFCTCTIPVSGPSTCATPSLPSGTTQVLTCPLQSTRANDAFLYIQEEDFPGTACTFFQGLGLPLNGPTGGDAGLGVCVGTYANYLVSSGNLIPSSPQTTTVLFTITNNSSLNANYNAFLATYLAAPNGGAAKRKQPPFYVRNKGHSRRVPA